ncbi:MAG: dienelactone hydrolase family protein [Pontiella sp.]
MKKWMFGALITGFAFAVQAGTAVDYTVGDTVFEGFIENAGADAPLVLLIHDWDGLTEYEIKRAGMLNDLGYSVFAIDLYGKGIRPTTMEDKRKCMTMLSNDRPIMRAYMKGALVVAEEQGLNTDQCVVVGYCFGGTAALELARSGEPLKGFATFHGGLALPEGQNYSEATGEFLIMHGTADSHIGMDQFAALATDLEKAGQSHQMITYGGAPHGWTIFGGKSYREKQDAQSWNHFVRYLDAVLK